MTTCPVCQFSYGGLRGHALVGPHTLHEVVHHRYDVDRILGQT